MKEKNKYIEAKHFYEQMKVHKMDQDIFEHNLSAFLTSSRTVFQYALAESQGIIGGQRWYDMTVSSSPMIQYLKDKRDTNIHIEPVSPQKNLLLKYNLTIKSSIFITKFDKDGKVVSQSHTNKSPETEQQKRSSRDVIYRFKDWSGSEDIITLCGLYLKEIDRFINEGIKLKFISG
jgi:hypothetical protein